MELYKKYRPKNLKQVIGQEEAVKTLAGYLKDDRVPHTIMFTGPSGCGKTTLARILQNNLGCLEDEYQEINAAMSRGIDMVKDIDREIKYKPMGGKCKVYYFDEAHKLTNDAQNSLLKMLEDTPDYVYFMLATSEPGKVINAIRTRCAIIPVEALDGEQLLQLVQKVAGKENIELSEATMEAIVEASGGSARRALVLLDKIMGLDPESHLDCIQKEDVKKTSFELAKELIWERTNWKKVRKILEDVKDSEPEDIRRLVLACAAKEVLKGSKLAPKAYRVLVAFEANFYDSGYPGLVRASWEAAGK